MLPGAIPSVVVQGLRSHLQSDTRKSKVVSAISKSSISEISITLSFNQPSIVHMEKFTALLKIMNSFNSERELLVGGVLACSGTVH
jgi:hypothetical protein